MPSRSPTERARPTAAAVVLAAGRSSRMGVPKSLLRVDGRPALEHIVATLRTAGIERVVVVLGAHACRIRGEVELGDAQVVHHIGWAAGRTSSLHAGLAALPDDVDKCLLALVDMPLVEPETVRAIVDRAAVGDAEVLAPRHDGRHGHPILLRRSLFPAIAALGPDEPLRALLRCRTRDAVAVDDPGILLDLDTPEDLVGRPRISWPDRRG